MIRNPSSQSRQLGFRRYLCCCWTRWPATARRQRDGRRSYRRQLSHRTAWFGRGFGTRSNRYLSRRLHMGAGSIRVNSINNFRGRDRTCPARRRRRDLPLANPQGQSFHSAFSILSNLIVCSCCTRISQPAGKCRFGAGWNVSRKTRPGSRKVIFSG